MYICCHRAGKAKDLYSRSFLLDARDTERQARDRQNGERIEREAVCRASFERMSREWQKERKGIENAGSEEEGGEEEGERAEKDGGRRGGGARFFRRAGRINKRGAPPSHLRHLYSAAAHGRKSSSVSEIRGV